MLYEPIQDLKALVSTLSFERATLELLQKRQLQKRVDTKYVIPLSALSDVLGAVQGEYALLYAGNEVLGEYRTLYLDTPKFDMIREHHRGRKPRKKVRIRHYVERKCTFLEVKAKTNAGRTLKQRTPMAYQSESLSEEAESFLQENAESWATQLVSSLRTDFSRLTLLGLNSLERVTFDVNLRLQDDESEMGFPGAVIVEVKQDRYRPRSPLRLALRECGYRPRSLSKYCIAALLFVPQLGLNRFLPGLKHIRKLSDGMVA